MYDAKDSCHVREIDEEHDWIANFLVSHWCFIMIPISMKNSFVYHGIYYNTNMYEDSFFLPLYVIKECNQIANFLVC